MVGKFEKIATQCYEGGNRAPNNTPWLSPSYAKMFWTKSKNCRQNYFYGAKKKKVGGLVLSETFFETNNINNLKDMFWIVFLHFGANYYFLKKFYGTDVYIVYLHQNLIV